MIAKQKKPAAILSEVGAYYEVTILDDVDHNANQSTSVIRGELRGWEFDENRGLATVLIWEAGATKAEEYYEGDILAVTPIEKPLDQSEMFFEPYKGRTIEIGQKVDVYRNLHTDNGYSIRDSKTGLVLAHCSTVYLTNATFHISESGRQKTVREKRKRVHAYIRGTLTDYNVTVPGSFKKVLYNPYFTESFIEAETNTQILNANEVICSGKHAYVGNGNESKDLFSFVE